MATVKPKIVIYSDDETIKKLDELAKANSRSRGNMAQVIIEEYIKGHYTSNTTKSIKIGRDNNGNVSM